jgi:transcriptional regulator
MYRPAAFAIDDKDTLHAFIRAHPFATIAAIIGGSVQFAYAPVVIDASGGARFHLARNNPLAGLDDGAGLRLSFLGADAYVSPDWYVSAGMVPTWNYSAVEGEGAVRRLDEAGLRTLLIDLSAAEEAKLLPKKPWTIDKVPDAKLATLMNAIVGFAVRLEVLEGKFKLSQNVKPEDFDGALRGLEARSDAGSAAVAGMMRKLQS